MNLEKLQKVADAIIADEEVPQDDPDAHQAHELLGGTSMGGARPKAVVEDDDGLWIAKFNRNDDNWNYAKIERAMLMLATEFGSLAQQALIQRLLDESDWWPRRVFDEVLRQSVPGTQEAPQRLFACDDAGQLVA